MQTQHIAKVYILLALLGFSGFTLAQSCEINATVGDMKTVQIEGITWFAMPREQLLAYQETRQSLSDTSAELSKRDELLKVVQAQRDDLLKRLAEYNDLVERYTNLQEKHDALNQDYQQSLTKSLNLNQQYDTKAQELIGLTKKYDTHIEDWRKHAEECRNLATQTQSGGMTFDVGLGATTGDSSLAGMLGIGIGKYKAWGFLQKDNSGIMVGRSFDF